MNVDFRQELNRSPVFGPWDTRAENWEKLWSAIVSINPSSILNIGMGKGEETVKWMNFLHSIWPSIQHFSHLEIDENVAKLNRERKNPFVSNVITGDVRTIDKIFDEKSVDLVFWSHGPEHIVREEWEETFKKLEEIATISVILQCPYGTGYDFMPEHVAKNILEDELERFGYTVKYTKCKEPKACEILAWRMLK